jgi:hypothetical protein
MPQLGAMPVNARGRAGGKRIFMQRLAPLFST